MGRTNVTGGRSVQALLPVPLLLALQETPPPGKERIVSALFRKMKMSCLGIFQSFPYGCTHFPLTFASPREASFRAGPLLVYTLPGFPA